MSLKQQDKSDINSPKYEYYNEKHEDSDKKYKLRRQIEDKLEKKRLREEIGDDFDDWADEFDWNE